MSIKDDFFLLIILIIIKYNKLKVMLAFLPSLEMAQIVVRSKDPKRSTRPSPKPVQTGPSTLLITYHHTRSTHFQYMNKLIQIVYQI